MHVYAAAVIRLGIWYFFFDNKKMFFFPTFFHLQTQGKKKGKRGSYDR